MNTSLLRLPREVYFGSGSLSITGKVVRAHGVNALICSDRVIGGSDVAAQVRASLTEAGVAYREFLDGEADVPLSCVDACLEFARAGEVDVIIGLGGGSSMDLAKAVAILLVDPGPLERFYGENMLNGPVIPVVAIPTTAGTGSEVTPVAVFADPNRALKVGVSDPRLVPVAAICDPETTLSCPPSVTGFSGVDALTHAVEAFCAPPRPYSWEPFPGDIFRGAEELTRHYAILALGKIANSLEKAYADGSNLAAREEMLYSSLCAGIAFGHAGTASAHALQYPIGAMTHTAHGLGVALLLPYTLEVARPDVDGALADVAHALGVGGGSDPATAAIDEIERLTQAVGVPRSLAEIGVERGDLAKIAHDAIGITRLVRNSPRPMTEADFVTLLEACWAGDRSMIRG